MAHLPLRWHGACDSTETRHRFRTDAADTRNIANVIRYEFLSATLFFVRIADLDTACL